MELNDFVNKFAEQFENTDLSVFNPETKFKDLEEWSSFTAVVIIGMVYDDYEVDLKGSDFRECNTIEDLYNIVCNRSRQE